MSQIKARRRSAACFYRLHCYDRDWVGFRSVTSYCRQVVSDRLLQYELSFVIIRREVEIDMTMWEPRGIPWPSTDAAHRVGSRGPNSVS